MAMFAKSKRFQNEACGSDIGPGDYNPSSPKPNAAGAVSLGFTSPKGLPNSLREQVIEEETNLPANIGAARHRRTSAALASAGRRTTMVGPRSAASAAASRLEKIEAENVAKQLSWSEREREKLQVEVVKIRQREATLIKSERQARAESAKAISARETLTKRAEAAERKASIAETGVARLDAAEAETARLKAEREDVRKAAEQADAERISLQTENDSLKSRVLGLEERMKGYLDKDVEHDGAMVPAGSGGREEDLERRVRELEVAHVAVQEELTDARASLDRNMEGKEEASKRVRSVEAELAAASFGARSLEKLASRLWSELEASKGGLTASEDSRKVLEERIEMLGEDWQERARMLELEIEVCKGDLNASEDDSRALTERIHMANADWEERARMLEADREVARAAMIFAKEGGSTAGEVKMSAVESDRDDLRARLERAEIQAAARLPEKLRLEEALEKEKANRGEIKRELASAKEAFDDAVRSASSLEARLAEKDSENGRLKRELDDAWSQLVSRDDSRNKLEASHADNADSIASLQQRLGDALAEGVEYADQAILSEERLRSSEADCAALWGEREAAREQLRVALLEGRELTSKLEAGLEEMARLREALQQAEARLTSAVEDGEELEEELAASRDQFALAQKELERARERQADACSEVRLLKASCQEGREELTRLEQELARAEAGRADAVAEKERLRTQLSLTSKKQKRLVQKEEPTSVHAHASIGADEFATLEAKLFKAESTSDRLRSSLESTEMEMSEVRADSQRSRFDLEDALRKCTNLQERLSEVNDHLKTEAADRRRANECLSRSAKRVAELERALQEAEGRYVSTETSKEELDEKLKEVAAENARLQESVTACEGTAEGLRRSLAAALADRETLANHVVRLEADIKKGAEECKALRETEKAVVEKVERSTTTLKAIDAEAVRLRCEIAAKDAELAQARVRLEATADRLEDMTGRLEDTTGRLEAAKALAVEQESRSVEYEVEGARLMEVLDGIEADFTAGQETTADLKQDLADVHGIGVHLAERLAYVVSEKNKIADKLDVAAAALVASAAHRRRLEREFETREAIMEEMARETEGLRKECERLREAGQSQAKGAQALLEEGEARHQETIARLQLTEIKSARATALAKKEAQRAKYELEAMSAEIKEMRALNDSLRRAQAEGGRATREAGLPKEQDIKKHNTRFLQDSAALSSELALATAVLEAVGVLPKEDGAVAAAASRREYGQSEEHGSPEVTGRGRGLLARALSGAYSRGRSQDGEGTSGCPADIIKKKKAWSPVRGRKPSKQQQQQQKDSAAAPSRTKSRMTPPPRVSLQERLIRAVEAAEADPSHRKEARKPLQRQLSGTTPGCFSSISCAAGDLRDDAPARHDSLSPGCCLGNIRVRDEVRRVLLAQAEGGGVSGGGGSGVDQNVNGTGGA